MRAALYDAPPADAPLDEWGYPHVLDEFRFHMALTGPVDEAETVDPDPAQPSASIRAIHLPPSDDRRP